MHDCVSIFPTFYSLNDWSQKKKKNTTGLIYYGK